jgi:hydrogenase nickel incorporation protein HypA/HybF
MHEIGLAQDVLKKALALAEKQGLVEINHIKVIAGETLLLHPEEFDDAFDKVAKGTIADGAKIELHLSPLKAKCKNCGREFTGKENMLACSACGSKSLEIISGNELKIAALE